MGKLNNVSLCHSNIRGLTSDKLRAIKNSLCYKYDIITLSETFLSVSGTVNLELQGYHPVIRRDRETFGGGLAIYVKDNILFKHKVNFSSNNIENLWIEISTVQGKLFICNCYRPPSNDVFWECLSDNVEHVKSESRVQNMVLLVDFNADLSPANGNKLLEFCLTYNLQPIALLIKPSFLTITS